MPLSPVSIGVRRAVLAAGVLVSIASLSGIAGAQTRIPMSVTKIDGSAPPPPGSMTLRTSAPTVSTKELPKFDPVAVLLDKKKDLKLDSAQQTRLGAIDAPVRELRELLIGRIESAQTSRDQLAREYVAALTKGGDTATTRSRLAATDTVVLTSVSQLRSAYRDAAGAALAVLTPDQLRKGTELIDKTDREMEKNVISKLSGR